MFVTFKMFELKLCKENPLGMGASGHFECCKGDAGGVVGGVNGSNS